MFKNEQPLYVIYMVTNSVNGKSYIGKTVQGVEVRWKGHLSYAHKDRELKSHFSRAIKKYDESVWDICLLYISFKKDDDHLYNIEKQLIYDLDTFHNGYNSSPGGKGCGSGKSHHMFNKTHTQEAKAKMSAVHLGRKHTTEQNMAQSLRQIGVKHPPRSEEFKQSQREAMLGRKQTESQKIATSKRMKGNTFCVGYKWTEEQNKNKSLVQRSACSPRRNNKSGCTGVSLITNNGRWHTRIYVHNKTINVGYFKNKNDAIIARLMAELDYWDQIRIYDY